MRPLHEFTVVSQIPEPLSALSELAANLHWAWDRELAGVFDRLDGSPTGASWRVTGQHPVDLVRRTSPACWAELADDHEFVAAVGAAQTRLRSVLDGSPWFAERAAESPLQSVAYFSPEFGITEALPQYSGGLGILAGDHLKASSDLGVPLVGVGLLYAGLFIACPSVLTLHCWPSRAGRPAATLLNRPGRCERCCPQRRPIPQLPIRSIRSAVRDTAR